MFESYSSIEDDNDLPKWLHGEPCLVFAGFQERFYNGEYVHV
jgi:hypothetical protein